MNKTSNCIYAGWMKVSDVVQQNCNFQMSPNADFQFKFDTEIFLNLSKLNGFRAKASLKLWMTATSPFNYKIQA